MIKLLFNVTQTYTYILLYNLLNFTYIYMYMYKYVIYICSKNLVKNNEYILKLYK